MQVEDLCTRRAQLSSVGILPNPKGCAHLYGVCRAVVHHGHQLHTVACVPPRGHLNDINSLNGNSQAMRMTYAQKQWISLHAARYTPRAFALPPAARRAAPLFVAKDRHGGTGSRRVHLCSTRPPFPAQRLCNFRCNFV